MVYNTELISYSLNDMKEWYEKQALPMWEINNDKLVYRPDQKPKSVILNGAKSPARIKRKARKKLLERRKNKG